MRLCVKYTNKDDGDDVKYKEIISSFIPEVNKDSIPRKYLIQLHAPFPG